jgi:hypothetical protein
MTAMLSRRSLLTGIGSLAIARAAHAVALPPSPLWFKRAGGLLPANSANESDIIAYGRTGQLLLATFNRSPLAQNVSFYDVSNPSAPTLIRTIACPGAMGAMFEDAAGVLHLVVSNPPAQNSSPFNSLIHCALDSSFNIVSQNTIFGPSGMGFNNVAANRVPGGYLLAVEQQYPSYTLKAESYLFSTTPDFASFTVKNALYNPPTDFTGRCCIRTLSDGWTYITGDTSQGDCRIARTNDAGTTLHFATNTNFAFLGPGSQDAYPGTPGGKPSYDGNVNWAEWSYGGSPGVYCVYFSSNEVDNGQLMLGFYPGSALSLVAPFNF